MHAFYTKIEEKRLQMLIYPALFGKTITIDDAGMTLRIP
jgi:hypothetical protein